MFKKNINITKRVSAFLLALIMLLGALPLNVFAEGLQGKTANPIVIDSDTINKDGSSGESKDPTTGPTKHTINFNPNGGTGDMESVEVEDGKEYSLPKNKFKAPEGKEFKNWLMDKGELKEGHKLVVTKDIELKANWKDIKVNPVKKALNSLIGKDDKEELDVGKELVGEAVTKDGEYTGPAHNSVVSSDGKVQIRNFEVFWTSTDGDTITFNNAWESNWYKYANWEPIPDYYSSPSDRPYVNRDYNKNATFSSETKIQINWALSGEKMYNKGDMEITLPLFAYNNDKALSFKITGYSIPKVVFNEDGSINYNADYGNATLAYYYDEETKSTKIINILDLAPGASGTLTLTYGDFNGNVRFIKDSEVAAFQPTLSLKYNDEFLETKDRELKIKLETKFDARLVKNGEAFTKWQSDWGDNIKPENPDDYFYVKYRIEPQIDDTLQTNVNIKLADVLGEVYSDGKKVNAEQEIIAYSDINSKKLINIPTEKSRIEFSTYNLNLGEDESKIHSRQNPYIYRRQSYKYMNLWRDGGYHPAYKTPYAYVLVKISKEKLGHDEKKSCVYTFKNDAELEVSPNNSNQKKITKNVTGTVELKYTYFPPKPKWNFVAPVGNKFGLNKSFFYNTNSLVQGKDLRHDIESTNLNMPYNKYSDNYFNKKVEIDEKAKKYEDRKVYWKVGGYGDMLYQTYDPEKGKRDDFNAYGQKEYTFETVDGYLYLDNDYSKPLTSDDYEVTSVILDVATRKYGFNEDHTYFDSWKTKGVVPVKILARKEATGEWIDIAEFNYKTRDYSRNNVSDFKALTDGVKLSMHYNRTFYDGWVDEYVPQITIPSGYTSVKMQNKTNAHIIHTNMFVFGKLKMSDKVKKYIDSTTGVKSSEKYTDAYGNKFDGVYEQNITIRNDANIAAYDDKDNLVGFKGIAPKYPNYEKTLELDKENYGEELCHDAAYYTFFQYKDQVKVPPVERKQELTKSIMSTKNNAEKKGFDINTIVSYREKVKYTGDNGEDFRKHIHYQNKGIFYDLLPLGISGVDITELSGHIAWDKPISEFTKEPETLADIIDKDTGSKNLKYDYKLIPNWRGSGRTMLVVNYYNAKPNEEQLEKSLEKIPSGVGAKSEVFHNISLRYNMFYPWDSYKDYGSKINRNLVAYESGFEKRPDDGLDDSLTNELEFGHNDSNPGLYKDYSYNNGAKEYYVKKIFTDQEIEWMKDLNPNHDEKRFLYAQASTTVSGDTEANVGLTKHVATDINPNFTLKSTTKEGGNYQYKIRLQAAHGTSVSNLVFFDSIENYDPLKADEDYGVKQWRGTLSSIDLNHPIMKGIAPKVYVSTKPKLDIEKHNDVSDSSVWKLYKEGDDLSNVQAVAIDLRKNKDGSDFKLEQNTAINVYLNMKAPWNLKEKQIDPKAKALNAIYASNTVTTSLDNKSTKLIYTAYTAVDLKPVTTETQIKATKKHLDKEGKDIALKGDDFKFELRDSNNKVLQTKTNDNKGNITFDPIKYNSWDVGEHTYKIVEVKGDSETTAYDSHEEIVKVKVERSGDSELKATTTYDKDGAAFNNHEVDAITASLEAKKVYIGKGGLEEKPTAGAFEFILKDAEGKEVAKATNDGEGKVVFEGLEFKPNQIGEHKYTIEEVKGKDPTIEYDNTKKNVTVNISLTKDFKLKADVVYEGEKIPTFTNTLKSASLQLVKLKDGSDPFILDEVKDKNGFLTSYKVPEAQKDNVLDGAEYKLYKLTEGKEELVATLITKNGISQVVQDIMPGKYKLKETKAPKGYTLNDKDLIFDITDKDAGTIVAKFATDDSIIDMPSTGGQGTKALMIGGGILVAIMAGVLVVANKKKKEELNK